MSRERGPAFAFGCGRFLLVVCILLFILIMRISAPAKPRPTPSGQGSSGSIGVTGSGTPAGAMPGNNPIAELLAEGAAAPEKDGIAVSVLIDTSGSMRSPVKDTDGSLRPKIEIARRAVLDIIRLAADYRKKNPALPLCVGIHEFSARGDQPNVRLVLPSAEPDPEQAEAALARLRPSGGTPIGDAMIEGKRDLDKLSLKKMHLVVVTDGENTHGYRPGDVAEALAALPEEKRASVYFVAFDTDAKAFEPVRNAGGLVMSAANAQELHDTLQYVFTGKILVEQPIAP
ncbi:MAG: VWA domain-containing protein [Planctomycetes bacterium]|nr:VWA domain-containing protein [Planctomycetota bacterium]